MVDRAIQVHLRFVAAVAGNGNLGTTIHLCKISSLQDFNVYLMALFYGVFIVTGMHPVEKCSADSLSTVKVTHSLLSLFPFPIP